MKRLKNIEKNNNYNEKNINSHFFDFFIFNCSL